MKNRPYQRTTDTVLRHKLRRRAKRFAGGDCIAVHPTGAVSKLPAGPISVPRQTVEVASTEFTDGTQIELIEDPHDSTKSLLAIFRHGEVRFTDRLESEQGICVPVPRTANLLRHVRLPRGVEPYGTVDSLVGEISNLLHRVMDLSEDEIGLFALFILSTWLIERVAVAPYVALVGLPGSGKSTALAMLRLLCRRALLTADISSTAFYEVCDRFKSTVLIDEAGTNEKRQVLLHLLRTGTTRDVTAFRKDKSFSPFGPKAVAWVEPPSDAALNSRCIVIPVRESRRTDLLRPTDPEVIKMADVLQMRLLRFRLEKLRSLPVPKIKRNHELRLRSRDLWEALALPVAENPERCQWLAEQLKAQGEVNGAALSAQQSAVFTAVFATMHLPPEGAYRVGDLMALTNTILQHSGERFRVNAREVGAILTSLGFAERKRTNRGLVISVCQKELEHAHNVAATYGVAPISPGFERDLLRTCSLCKRPSMRWLKPVLSDQDLEMLEIKDDDSVAE